MTGSPVRSGNVSQRERPVAGFSFESQGAKGPAWAMRRRLLAGTATLFLSVGAAWAETAHIPLSYVVDNGPDLRLVIWVGIGDGAAKPYLFDTGSTSFNLANQSAWVPPPSSTLGTNVTHLYSNASFGYIVDQVTYPTLKFYSATGTLEHTLNATSAGDFQVGIGTFVTDDPSRGVGAPITVDGVTYYEQATWAAALQAGTPPEYGTVYGTFGAGFFVTSTNVPGVQSASVLGQATTSGYVVSANGPTTPNAQLPCNPCLTLGLTPELRAQFTTLVPWSQNGPSFPVSGANGGVEQGVIFTYTLSAPGLTSVTWSSATLLDTGTPTYHIKTSENIAAYLQGIDVIAGTTMTVSGTVANAQTTTITAQAPTVPPTNDVSTASNSVLGVGIYQQNSFLYDLENRVVGYTSNFVTDVPVTSQFNVGPALGPIGLAGVVSGSDGIQVEAGGLLTLSASNTYTGRTVVDAGGALTLAGPGSVAASSELQVDGTLDISRVTAGTAIQTLAGNGTVALGNQTLTITNGSSLFAGTLQDGGQINFIGGNVVIAGGQQTFSGTNTYTGGTAIYAGARLTLSGTLAGTVANGGVFESTGTVTGVVVNAGEFINNGVVDGQVRTSGLLKGNGSINGTLTVGGRVSPGNSIGTLTVNGLATFQAGASYGAELGAAGTSDLIAVTGPVIAGGVITLLPTTGFTPTLGAHYRVLTATDGIVGSFAVHSDAFGTPEAVLPFLAGRLDQHFNTVDVTLVRSHVPFSALATTANAAATAAGLQDVALESPLGTALVGLPGAQAQAAFNGLSGEAYASVGTMLQQQSVYVREAVGTRLRQSLAAPGTAPLGYGPQTAALGEGLTPTLWTQGYGGWGDSFSNGNAATLSNSIGGFLMGLDVAVAPNARAGLFAGFSQSQFTVTDRASSGSTDNYDIGLYAGAQAGVFAMRVGAAYGWHDLSLSRSIAFSGFAETTQGGASLGTTQVFGELGYNLAMGAAAIEPFAGLAYVNMSGATLTESGGAAALSVSTGGMDTLYSTLGVRLATSVSLGGSTLMPRLMFGWQHAFGDTTPTATLQLPAGGTPFGVSGVPIAEDALLLEAGLSYALSDKAAFGAAYTSQLAGTASQNAFTAQFSLKF